MEVREIIIWSCFSASNTVALHVLEGNINGVMYQDILQENLISSTKKLKLDVSTRQLPETAKTTDDWFLKKKEGDGACMA